MVGLRVVRAGRRGRLREVHRVAELLALAAVRPATARRAPWSLRLARTALQLRSVEGTQVCRRFDLPSTRAQDVKQRHATCSLL